MLHALRSLFYSSVCKPGSVLNGHQSSHFVAEMLRGDPRATSEHMPDRHSIEVLLRIGFTADLRYRRNG